jgi:hypothetical protein
VYSAVVAVDTPATLATASPLFIGYGSPPWTPPASSSSSSSGPTPPTPPFSATYILYEWAQFVDGPQQFSDDLFLAGAVQGFFLSGGQQCQVVLLDQTLAFRTNRPSVLAWQQAFIDVLFPLDSVDLACIPSLMWNPVTKGPITVQEPTSQIVDPVSVAVYQIQALLLVTCEQRGNVFAILDSLPGPRDVRIAVRRVDTQQKQLDNAIGNAARNAGLGDIARSGAVYFPWVLVVASPGVSSATLALPPSGHIAGVYSLTDNSSGADKAPANEPLVDVVDLQCRLGDIEQSRVNERINCLRIFPGLGAVVWGARTLSSDETWYYVGVRRLITTLGRWLVFGTSWAVFEPNDMKLWLRMNRQLTAYLDGLFIRGVLKGRSPSEAYFVKCDAENNPPQATTSGTVYVEVGVAPATPAELIVVRLTQSAAGASLEVGGT